MTNKHSAKGQWELWLDDEKEPPQSLKPGTVRMVARSVNEAKQLVLQNGPPAMMWLDHDLGMVNDKPSDSLEFLDWFVCMCQDIWGHYPEFDYYVISNNGPGRKRIETFMTSYLRMSRQ